MIYSNKIPNLLPTKQIVREALTQPISEGSLFLYPYADINRLAYLINDTYNTFDKHFAVNKVVDVYVPKLIQVKSPTLTAIERVDQNKLIGVLKDKCESLSRFDTTTMAVGKKNVFYDLSSHIDILNRKLKTFKEEAVTDALNFIFKAFDDFPDHNKKYVLLSLDVNTMDSIPVKTAAITVSLYKSGFNIISYLLYHLKFNEADFRSRFKGVVFMFMSKTGCFKFDIDQLPPYSEKDDTHKILEQVLMAIRRIIRYESAKVDDVEVQEEVMAKIKADETKPEHVASLLAKANKAGDINIDEYEVVKPEDKDKVDAIKAKDRLMNKKMSELMHNADDDKSAVMLEQYVKTVADNPDDVKAAIGAGIIKDIKDQIIKKDTRIYNPKEKKLLTKLEEVTIRDKTKATVLDNYKGMNLQEKRFDINGIDDSMKSSKFVNFNKSYDKHVKDVHIKRIAKHFSKCDVPLYVTNIEVKDVSDEFNHLDKYKFTFKDADNVQSTVSINMPKYTDGKFLYIGGTKFVLYNQLTPFPVVKIGEDVIVTTARNKATLSYKGTKYTSVSQANLSKGIDKLDKDKYKDILLFGDYYDSNLSSNKTNVEYAYISKQIIGIKSENIDFTFKYDDSIDMYGDMSKEGFIALGKYKNNIIKLSLEDDKVYGDASIDGLDLTEMLVKITADENNELGKVFKMLYDADIDPNISDLVSGLSKSEIPELYQNIMDNKSITTQLTQTHVKIMGRWIPLIYVLMYTNGLFSVLDRAKIDYRLVYHIDPKHPDKPKSRPRIIKSKQFLVETFDAWIIFNMNNVDDISLTYPLSKMDFRSYKTSELENKDFLSTIIEDYGGSINLPIYLDRFRENFIDPMTFGVLEDHKIPTDFMGLMLYANGVLGSGKNSSDKDLSQYRLRGEESLVSMMYEAIAKEYEEYSVKKKRGNIKGKFTINENAVLNIMHDMPSLKPYSSLNPINEMMETHTVMFKGHRGSNMDRAYTLEKRMYDESFYGVVGLSSSQGGGVGINKQLVIDPSVVSPEGYLDIKGTNGAKNLKASQLLTPVEALHPFSVNHDDPQRVTMNASQAQQILPVDDADPMLVSYGYDEVLAKVTSDFAISAKMNGTILTIDDNSIVIQYDDKTKEVRQLKTIEKNSAKNFYTTNTIQLKKGITVGKKVKEGDIIGYNPKFFKDVCGDIVFTPGPMIWVAVTNDDVVYEDSTVISESMSKRCAKEVIKHYPIKLDKATKINTFIGLNHPVYAGDKLMTFNKTSDDEFYNQFLEDAESDLLTVEKKAKRAGKVVEIRVYYCDEFTSLSKSIRDFIDSVDRIIRLRERSLNNHGSEFDRNTKSTLSKRVQPGTKVNGSRVDEGKVLIEYYVESRELMGVGDKGTYNAALKGIVADIRPDTSMPMALTSKRRVDACLRSMSIGNRKTYSIYYQMGINKALLKTGSILQKMFEKY